MRLLVLFVLAACVALTHSRTPPSLPSSYLATYSVFDEKKHEGLPLSIVVAVDESVGVYVNHLASFNGGLDHVVCINATEGVYDCYTYQALEDPIGCAVTRKAARNIYELGLLPIMSDPSTLTYLRSDVLDGAVVEHWFDKAQNLIWVVRRDQLRIPVKILSSDMSTYDIRVVSFAEASDVSSLVVPPAVPCEMQSTSVASAEFSAINAKRVVEDTESPALTQEFVNKLNKREKKSWTAEISERFATLTLAEIDEMLGVRGSIGSSKLETYEPVKAVRAKREVLPENFDAREIFGAAIHPIQDQGHCGSCWAHASGTAFGDRMSIAQPAYTEGASRQYIVSCNLMDAGCKGGSYYEAALYLCDSGVVSEKCVPTYKSYNGTVAACPLTCEDGSQYTIRKAVDAFHVVGEENIKYELYHHGPLRADFYTYLDLYAYKSGVYVHDPSLPIRGEHAVRLIGWGFDEESQLPYWLLLNSWGESWGINGAFKVIRGINECGIEAHISGNHAPVSTNDNACNYNMCQNGAKCVATFGQDSRCECLPGFVGKYCSLWSDPCLSNPCNGNGVCTSTANTDKFTCLCYEPFAGETCSVMKCGDYNAPAGYAIKECNGDTTDSECVLECSTGFTGVASKVSCIHSSWSAPSGCKPVSCGALPTQQGYSQKTCTGTSYTDMCHVTCSNDYAGQGGVTMCGADGKWTTFGGCVAPGKSLSHLNAFEVISIVIGSILGLGVIAGAAFFVGHKRARKARYTALDDVTSPSLRRSVNGEEYHAIK